MAGRKSLPYQDVKLPVNDPLMPLSQINGLHGGYAQMMHDSYIAHRAAAVERQRGDMETAQRLEVARVAREQAILTIVLAGMTLESAVNAMGAHYFPGNRFRACHAALLAAGHLADHAAERFRAGVPGGQRRLQGHGDIGPEPQCPGA